MAGGEKKKTVSFTIDGKPFEAEAGRTVLEVALKNRIQIPYFCYHPYLSVPGNCRQCQVKVGMPGRDGGPTRWMPKLMVSCNTQVAEGMEVDTRAPEVKKAQAANMEFLLINHPLDCPICDQVGECWLQEHAFARGPGRTRFREEKVHLAKRVDVGPHVLLDRERCIQCTRCIRFCDEISRSSELALFSRSDRSEIGIFPGRPLANPYSGNVVDICPVGALTLKEFRFQSRLWFLNTTSSVCPGCARGCSIKLWHRDGAVERITPRENPEVNQTWICDHGRLICGDLAVGERIREPRHTPAKNGGEGAVPLDWPRALEEAAALLKQAHGRVGAVIRAWATLEEAYLACHVLQFLAGQVQVAVPQEMEGEDDDLLIRADRTPNRQGLLALLSGCTPGLVELSTLLGEAAGGRLQVLLVIGQALMGAGAHEQQVDQALAQGLDLILLADAESRTAKKARIVLPAGRFPEVEGTVVNFQGRVQRMKSAYSPPFLARAGLRILSDLARLVGAPELPQRPRDLFDEMARREAAFQGLTVEGLGDLGALLPAEG
ncbi:MAG: 2Fe-2S iron-sulfur cluster-binding protein [Acidobacteriota bacterium]